MKKLDILGDNAVSVCSFNKLCMLWGTPVLVCREQSCLAGCCTACPASGLGCKQSICCRVKALLPLRSEVSPHCPKSLVLRVTLVFGAFWPLATHGFLICLLCICFAFAFQQLRALSLPNNPSTLDTNRILNKKPDQQVKRSK